jgi:hypothetical protein
MAFTILQVSIIWLAKRCSTTDQFSTVALTPVDSIAKPTISSVNLEVTTKAVPASSPKPTLAPVTFPSQAQVSSETNSPKQIPGPAEEPSSSQARKSNKQPVSAGNEQSQNDGRLEDGRPSPKPDNPVTSGTDATKLPSQATKPADDSRGSPGGQNALSVLSEAQSSAEAADPATPTPSNPTHDGPSTSDLVSATPAPESLTISLANGGSATVRMAESSFIIAQYDLSAAAALGGEVTIGAHVFSTAPQGDAVIVDSIATYAVPSSADSPPALIFTVDDRILSANQQGDEVLIFDGTKIITAKAGEPFAVGSQTFSVGAGASGLLVGTTTLAIPIKAQETTDFATAVWTADGSTFTAFKQDNFIVVHGPDLKMTLELGTTAAIAGEVLSVPVSGSQLFHGGNTATFESAESTAEDNVTDVTTLRANGQDFIASATANGDTIIIQQGSSNKLTLAAGQQTTVNGEAVSVAQSGGTLVIVNSSETVSILLSAASATVVISDSGFAGNSALGGSGSTGPTADGGGASSNTSTPDAMNLSGGVGRGSIDSVRWFLLLVFLVGCVWLL